ncbi:MAG TPA: DUF4936 family protein [Limnobacter sp.]|nr:DUF4936 family protein [Limnobacter sp.]
MNKHTHYFVYYRVEPAHLELAKACARNLFDALARQQLATGELFERTESGKPYHTLMEVLQPGALASSKALEFLEQIQPKVIEAFRSLPVPIERHSEVFCKLAS